MLVALGGVLDGWRPKPGPGAEPLVAVRAAWVDLVGADVARSAQPVALERDTLIVLTASSSWSAQLVFLEPQIVRALRALPGTRELVRLRFRVGTLRRPLPTAGEGPRGPRTATGGRDREPPAKTLDDALARLRRAVERTRRTHAAAGGAFCGNCQAAVDAGTPVCRPCRDDDERRRRLACERLVFEAPWLTPEAVLAAVDGLTADEYDAIRRRLLASWWDELRRASRLHALRQPLDRPRLRKLASSFVLLDTRIDPNRLELESPLRKNALGELFDFVRAIEREHDSPVQ